RRLAEHHYNLFLCSRSQSELDAFRQELLDIFPSLSIRTRATDLGDMADLAEFAGFVKQDGSPVDVLINNAGLFLPSGILDEAEDTLEKQFSVNVRAPHFLCKAFGREMKARRSGHLINISSVAAVDPVKTAGSYTVTKAALLSLTSVLREELMEFGVKVTAILPGSTLTGSWTGTTIPADRFIDPDDIANAVIMCLQASKGGNVDEIIIRPTLGNI
ncbi:MAG TPA: SDR family oxidoreductase, partial [Sphingobacteriaceae bacterium]